MSKFGVAGKMTTAPENRDAFIDILINAANIMEDLEGCQLYAVAKDANNDTDIWVMELWASKEAHEHALSLPEIRALIGQGMALLVGEPAGTFLEPVGGKGL